MIKQSDVAQIQSHIAKPFHGWHNEYVGVLFNYQKFDDSLDKGLKRKNYNPNKLAKNLIRKEGRIIIRLVS